ncbi:MAG: hypothetical protein WC678_00700 [Parcubacteria group bacterium]|jgi:hypothetical protein
MSKKTYWWRVITVLLFLTGTFIGYILFYPYQVGICNSLGRGCVFSALKRTIAEPLFLFSAFSSIVSIFLFFINDKIFLKWLRFAGVWIVLSIFAIAITPSHSGGILSFGGPSKEDVSIWMGALFVILSLAKIVWDSRKKD